MIWARRFFNSSIGMKTLMACSGLILVGFTAIHMLGNFNAYLGAESMNNYAKVLKSSAPILWGARTVLLCAFLTHIATAFRLTRLNQAARPIQYAKREPLKSSFASRTMLMSGLVLLCFILFHLAHFTLHWVGDIGHHLTESGEHDVYKMFVLGFQNPVVSTLYIIANAFLGLHMSHGIASAFQSLGLRDEKYVGLIRCAGCAMAWTIALGNISMPLAVLFGCISL